MDPLTDGKPIAGFPAYRVTPDGQVWTCWKRANTLGDGHGYVMGDVWKPRKFGKHKYGYYQLWLNDGKGNKRHANVHTLVLEAFVGPCPPGMQACHGHEGYTVNHIRNLRWDTPQSNQLDRKRDGTNMAGESHPMAKLTAEQVEEIRVLYGSGARHGGNHTQVELAQRFGIKQGHITKILRGLAWKQADKEITHVSFH